MSALDNWREEKRSAHLYEIISSYQTDETHKELFKKLAHAANSQADIWKKELEKIQTKVPEKYHPDLRTRLVIFLIKHIKTKHLRFILSAMKVRGMSIYSEDESSKMIASAMPHHEAQHRGLGAGGNLRAAVFGINDGLVSNVSLILGMVGARADHHFIILSGVAGLLAGAFSMGAGEYISVKSQREFFEYQINLEKNELEEYPEEEAHELALIYEARGLPKEEAEKLATTLIKDPNTALKTLTREELGLNPNDLGSPINALLASFFSFAIGAAIPLVPFLFGESEWNLSIAIGLTATTLFSIGAILSLFTNRSAWINGLRMLAVGAAAGVITFLIGKMIGVGIS